MWLEMEHSIQYKRRCQRIQCKYPFTNPFMEFTPDTYGLLCVGFVCLYSCHRDGELTIGTLFVTVMLPDNNRFKSITMAAPLEQ